MSRTGTTPHISITTAAGGATQASPPNAAVRKHAGHSHTTVQHGALPRTKRGVRACAGYLVPMQEVKGPTRSTYLMQGFRVSRFRV